MKCKICGKRANTIAGMARHYRKKHAGSMKRRKTQSSKKNSGTQTHVARRSLGKTHSDPSSSVPETPAGYVVETITWKRVA